MQNPATDQKNNIKTDLLERLVCPNCQGALIRQQDSLACSACRQTIPLQGAVPLFSEPPQGIQPSEKLVRGPNVGTPWRQANWRFLSKQLASLPPGAVILDVGAGRGDFADLLEGRRALALDIYPYPEIDIVCDLTQVNPFQGNSFDCVLLMNVLEHVYDTHAMLASLAGMLKPGGSLIVAIPFMVKMHQVPIDYVRFTHFALQRLGEHHGLAVEALDGFYDPISLLGEGTGNLKNAVLPTLHGPRHYAGRALLAGIQALSGLLSRVVGAGQRRDPAKMRSLAPTGYHIHYRKEFIP